MNDDAEPKLPPRSLEAEIQIRVEDAVNKVSDELHSKFDAETEDLKKKYEHTKSKLHWWSGGIGAAAIAAASAYVFVWMDDFSRTAVEDIEETVSASVEHQLQNGFLALSRENESAISQRFVEEVSSLTALSLLIGEAIDVTSSERRLTQTDTELLFQTLQEISPSIDSLEGLNFVLASRRIERILGVFISYGRFDELHRIFSAIPQPLQRRLFRNEDGAILHALANALSVELMMEGDLPDRRIVTLRSVLSQTPHPNGYAFEQQAILELLYLGSSVGWDNEQAVERSRSNRGRYDGFRGMFQGTVLCPVYAHFERDLSPRANQARARLESVQAMLEINEVDCEER